MGMDSEGNFDTGHFFDMGSFDVICDHILCGTGQITPDYRIHSKISPENLTEILSFIQEHYEQAYDQVLAGILSAYKKVAQMALASSLC